MPNYNVNNIPSGFKVHIKNRFALLNLIDQEPEELWTELEILLEKNARSKKGKKNQNE